MTSSLGVFWCGCAKEQSEVASMLTTAGSKVMQEGYDAAEMSFCFEAIPLAILQLPSLEVIGLKVLQRGTEVRRVGQRRLPALVFRVGPDDEEKLNREAVREFLSDFLVETHFSWPRIPPKSVVSDAFEMEAWSEENASKFREWKREACRSLGLPTDEGVRLRLSEFHDEASLSALGLRIESEYRDMNQRSWVTHAGQLFGWTCADRVSLIGKYPSLYFYTERERDHSYCCSCDGENCTQCRATTHFRLCSFWSATESRQNLLRVSQCLGALQHSRETRLPVSVEKVILEFAFSLLPEQEGRGDEGDSQVLPRSESGGGSDDW
uniref:Uncharacterized protein n=1 Tax=Chromera velia CCMP2878 TaxID=1169474 RepID=A0A0G4HJY1_9ALVE|eukprot:Cvel_7135.t1-p1 / transcript=Cvel_7135.t1 / gene=Cvel_7135 / organism=Chromera_velia_CCMP2878 / gene_product=hypothetical protein / transcript_product=hypothetical protein / location=Cvel_scaffold366:43709-44674(-) / protein_length=322 / sequence_SO=supercontig / SO=protein_coding / is_pseudo=false